jgi:hypothetical protein
MRIAVIPQVWKTSVIVLLEGGSRAQVVWTSTATSNWSFLDEFGTPDRAYDLLVSQLSIPGLLGHDHPPMQDAHDFSLCDTWAFLCPHPLGSFKKVYAKLALHSTAQRVNLISLHIDTTGEIEAAISALHTP